MLAKEKIKLFPACSPLLKPARLLIFKIISSLLAYYILLANLIFSSLLALRNFDERYRILFNTNSICVAFSLQELSVLKNCKHCQIKGAKVLGTRSE